MTFERSKPGQENRAKFLNVDYVVYVEGPDGATSGDDIAFWMAAFGAVRPDLKVRFVRRGGKPVLEGLAREIISNNTKNTLVAMDSDYGRFCQGRTIIDKRVLYTFGYSWENDLFWEDFLGIYYIVFAKAQNLTPKEQTFLRSNWDKFCRSFKWLMIADFLALRSSTSIIPRETPGRLVVQSSAGPVRNASQARALCAAANAGRRVGIAPYLAVPKEPKRYLVGKLIALGARYLISKCLDAHASSKLSTQDHLNQVALLSFAMALAGPKIGPVDTHYRALLRAI